MSEYWVSKKKYFCKYCDIYIADDAPSRQHHESGMRHKGSVERFIRGLYKGSEKKKKDLEEEKREMARVEQAAQAAYAQDVASGHARATAPEASSSKAAAPKPAPKPSNPFSNYSTAESLGYTDPDAERIAAEMERRRNQGVVGDWEVVSTAGPSTSTAPADVTQLNGEDEDTKPSLEAEGIQGGVKREAEAPPEEDERTFKLRKKTLGVGLREIYDPGTIQIKLKKKEEPTPPPIPAAPTASSSKQPASSSSSTLLPKWTPVQLKRPGEMAVNANEPAGSQTAIKSESQSDEPASSQPSTSKWTKIQWSTPSEPVKQEVGDTTPTDLDPSPTDTGAKAEQASPLIKTEPIVPKLEDGNPAALNGVATDTSTGGGMFRKRKIPARGGKRQ